MVLSAAAEAAEAEEEAEEEEEESKWETEAMPAAAEEAAEEVAAAEGAERLICNVMRVRIQNADGEGMNTNEIRVIQP